MHVTSFLPMHVISFQFYSCHFISFIHPFVHSFIRAFVHSLVRSFINSFIHSSIHSFPLFPAFPSFPYFLHFLHFHSSFIHSFMQLQSSTQIIVLVFHFSLTTMHITIQLHIQTYVHVHVPANLTCSFKQNFTLSFSGMFVHSCVHLLVHPFQDISCMSVPFTRSSIISLTHSKNHVMFFLFIQTLSFALTPSVAKGHLPETPKLRVE